MKFLAWFFAVLVFFSSFFIALVYNSRQVMLSPENTKRMLSRVDFYNQAKSVLKKDLFEAETNNADLASAAKNISGVMDQVDFQGKIENLVGQFYQGLRNGNSFILSVNLADFKQAFINQAVGDDSDGQISKDEIAKAIPDTWLLDSSKSGAGLSFVGFVYRNYEIILLAYLLMVLLFFVFCILISHKYLKLFFSIFLIVGILILLQRFAWAFINPDKLFASIIAQGRSGMGILVANFVRYFKVESSKLLFWESIGLIVPSIIGLIIVSVIPEKVYNIPLASKK